MSTSKPALCFSYADGKVTSCDVNEQKIMKHKIGNAFTKSEQVFRLPKCEIWTYASQFERDYFLQAHQCG